MAIPRSFWGSRSCSSLALLLLHTISTTKAILNRSTSTTPTATEVELLHNYTAAQEQRKQSERDSETEMMQEQEQGKVSMHMTFFWGKDLEVWFSGWPAGRLGMYLLSLVLVFVLSVSHEWLSFCRLLARPGGPGPASGLLQKLLHGLRVGVGYLVMLSFNVGVLLVAVASNAVGFLMFALAPSGLPSRHDPWPCFPVFLR